MKKTKRLIAIIAVMVLIGAAGAVYAAAGSPAEILSGLTGKDINDLYAERAEGKTYGAIAAEEGKLGEFKGEMLEQKESILEQRVHDGTLTREQADEIMSTIRERQATCDGTGNGGTGCGYGAEFGRRNGLGIGNKNGNGNGIRSRDGNGNGRSFGRAN